MLACKGIFATPSIDVSVEDQKSRRLSGILCNKILYATIITLYSITCNGNIPQNFRRLSVRFRAAVRVPWLLQ